MILFSNITPNFSFDLLMFQGIAGLGGECRPVWWAWLIIGLVALFIIGGWDFKDDAGGDDYVDDDDDDDDDEIICVLLSS